MRRSYRNSLEIFMGGIKTEFERKRNFRKAVRKTVKDVEDIYGGMVEEKEYMLLAFITLTSPAIIPTALLDNYLFRSYNGE